MPPGRPESRLGCGGRRPDLLPLAGARERRRPPCGARDRLGQDPGAVFARGEAAMMTNWFGFAAHAVGAADSPVRGKVGVAPMPHAPGAAPASVLVYWVLAVGSGSRHADLAWRFIRHADLRADGPAADARRRDRLPFGDMDRSGGRCDDPLRGRDEPAARHGADDAGGPAAAVARRDHRRRGRGSAADRGCDGNHPRARAGQGGPALAANMTGLLPDRPAPGLAALRPLHAPS